MDTAGQSQTTYAYDAADRLTGITRGSQSPTFGYDDANRLTSLALPGGVAMDYSYDAADRLTRITYANGSGELGRIDYGNDPAGRRQETSGSWARMDLPAAVGSGTFDAANRLTARGATTYSYDDDGNLTSDGTQTYAWNARGELTGLSGGSPTASFAYDAFGRRRQATIGATTTSYRYDGDNAVVETQGSSSVRTLAGLGIDSALTRSDGSGTEALLTDALGSTVALTDGSGAVQTEYSYDPFGTPSASGASSSNPTQFTGREWDGTGLQYSRARYYSPSMGRFISEDPLGFGGGDVNVYAYVGSSPLNATDPLGLCCSIGGYSLNPVDWNWSAGLDGGLTYTDTVTDFLPYIGTGKAIVRVGWDLATGRRDCLGADVAGIIPFRLGKALRFARRARGAAKAETRVAEKAFGHGYAYHPRVRARGLEDPAAHNFPYSFDDVILREKPTLKPDGSLLYRKAGTLKGRDGIYEIAVNPETNTIVHRTWRSR